MPYSTARDQVLPFAEGQLAPAARGRLGPALRAAREGLMLSIEDIAKATRIGLSYIVAIEEERFDAFAGGVYAAGFVRAYAREVGIAEEWAASALRDAIARVQPVWRRSGWVR